MERMKIDSDAFAKGVKAVLFPLPLRRIWCDRFGHVFSTRRPILLRDHIESVPCSRCGYKVVTPRITPAPQFPATAEGDDA